jgi:hypothetical protein
MWVAWLGTLFLVRYGMHKAFHHFSYHRGIWHSIVAGLFFWFLTAAIYKWMLGFHEGVAWLAGGFVFIGYLTHLILDEIYSVDVYDTRIKASFGTALKLYDGKHLGDTAVVTVLAVAAFLATPSAKPFVEGITSHNLWAGLHSRLLPHDHWFGIDIEQQRARLTPGVGPATSNVTTGSITPPALPPRPAPALPATKAD